MSDLTLVSLPYSNDLIPHYQLLSKLPDFIFLDSSDQQRGRYDIVTAYPYNRLKLHRDSPDLQTAFQQLQQMLPTACSACDLPFQGGAIGYIAYDLGEILAGIDSRPHPLNDRPLMDIRFYDWAIVTDHQKKEVLLVAANTQMHTVNIVDEISALWRKAFTSQQPFILEKPFTPLINQESYQQAFRAIHQDLGAGRAYQVNYTQPFVGYYKGSLWEMYKRVRQRNPVPYSAFLRCDEGDILSFSPECFLTMENGLVQTSPIKGTSKRDPNPIIDHELKALLKASAKNQAENTMIVDLLRNDLGKFAKPGSVKVTALCEVQSFNAVHHLVSTIEAVCMDGVTPMEVFAACFPGGSITGAPKRESMRIINEHEPYSRGVYCGSIVYFSAHGRFDSSIAIRTITAKNNALYLSAGGGIVIDSDWEDEYRECFTKILAIVNEC